MRYYPLDLITGPASSCDYISEDCLSGPGHSFGSKAIPSGAEQHPPVQYANLTPICSSALLLQRVSVLPTLAAYNILNDAEYRRLCMRASIKGNNLISVTAFCVSLSRDVGLLYIFSNHECPCPALFCSCGICSSVFRPDTPIPSFHIQSARMNPSLLTCFERALNPISKDSPSSVF